MIYKSDEEKQRLLNVIDGLTKSIKAGDYEEYIKDEHKKVFIFGQLDALLMIRETIEHEEYN